MIYTAEAKFVYDELLMFEKIQGLLVYYEPLKDVREIKDNNTPEFIIVDFVGAIPDGRNPEYISFVDGRTGGAYIVRAQTEVNYTIPVQRLE